MDISIKAYDSDEGFTFPINPESYDISRGSTDVSVNVHNLGEVMLKGKENLKKIGWSSLFPHEEYDFCQTTPLDDPKEYIDILQEWHTNRTTLTLDIEGVISINVVISDFNSGEQDRVGDIYYTLSLTEYKDIKLATTKKQVQKRPSKKVVAHLYKWKKGNTWKKVAKKEAGDSSRASALKKLAYNKKVLKKAKKAYKKKHPNAKKFKDATVLVGYKVMIK